MIYRTVFTILTAISLTGISHAGSAANLDLSSWLRPLQAENDSSRYQAYHVSRAGHVRSGSPFTSMDVKFDGLIRVGDNDRSIKSISPGGYLKISIRTFGNSRELLINSDSKGRLSYEFREGRKELPFEPEGRRWMEDVLIDVIRSSGIDAGGRTARIYSDGGMDAVLNEIDRIGSNSVKGMYFTALLEERQLGNNELSALAFAIAGKISSNTDRGRLFRKYQGEFLRDTEVAADYFSAISRLTSNTERGRIYRSVDQPLDFRDQGLTEAYFSSVDRITSSTEASSVLRHTIENQDLPVPAQVALLRSVTKISSNTESGRVLRSAGLDFSSRQVWEAFFRAVDRLTSNTETGATLRHILSQKDLDNPAMIAFLSSTRKISSNTERGSVMRSIREIDLEDAGVREAYFNVVRTTTSSTEAGRMLRYTLDKHTLNQASLINLYETARRISSATEVSSVLRASIPHLIHEVPVLDAFFACTNRLSSSTEQGRVLRSLAAEKSLNREGIRGILLSAQKISSSTERGSVIRSVAPRIGNDKALKDLYMETAKTLSSDSEFRRCMDAIM